MYKLIIEDDEGKTTVVPLIRDEISIGRKEGNTIRLTERNVSRRHAKLIKQTDQNYPENGAVAVFIEDLESYNGIKVNGNRISGRVAVAEGDRIQIGDYVLGLKVEGQAVSKPKPEVESSKEEDEDDAEADAPTQQIDVSGLPPEGEINRVKSDPGRVVCVSTNFARQEFVLDKPVMVIGRTDDNDIVINHRSISRHHARIVEENGRYKVIDMQSANGVRVNGEEYGSVELRKADYIDLGHVRLRFIAPGEDFDFDRDATVIDPQRINRSNSVVWVLLALIAVVAVGVLLWRLLTKSPSTAEVQNTEIVDHKDSTLDNKGKLLTDLNSAIDQRQWQRALELCKKLGDDARQSCEKAKAELGAKKIFDDANAAAIRNEHKKALDLFLKIPNTSLYSTERDKAKTFAKVKRNYLANAMSELDDLIKASDCDGAEKKASEIKKYIPDAKTDAKVGRCNKPVGVAKHTPVSVVQKKKTTTPKKKTIKTRVRRAADMTPEQKEAAKALADQVAQAWMNGNSQQALVLGQRYIRMYPADHKVLATVGASACNLKKASVAKRIYMRLKSSLYRNQLRNICMKNNIEIP